MKYYRIEAVIRAPVFHEDDMTDVVERALEHAFNVEELSVYEVERRRWSR